MVRLKTPSSALVSACAGFFGRGSRLTGSALLLVSITQAMTPGALAQEAPPVFKELVVIDGNGNVQPGLASSWSTSPDGLTFTFRLAADAHAASGAPAGADDVVASLHQAMESGELSGVAGASALDPETVEIDLAAADPNFLQVLASGVTAPDAETAARVTSTAPLKSLLSDHQRSVFNELLKTQINDPPKGYNVASIYATPNPPAGLAELTYVLLGSDSAAMGTVTLRFYRNADEAASYVGTTDASPFIQDAIAGLGTDTHWGDTKIKDVYHRWAWNMNDVGAAEDVWVATQSEDVVVIARLAVPRPGVLATDDIRPNTISDALDAASTLEAYLVLIDLKQSLGGDAFPQ